MGDAETVLQAQHTLIPIYLCFWSHDFTTHHSLHEKYRCDRELNQFKKMQISYCNVFK